MQKDFIPLSLDHDGLMALTLLEEINKDEFKETEKNEKESISQIIKELEIELSESMNEWSNYFLKAPLPIETKRCWFKGEVVEY